VAGAGHHVEAQTGLQEPSGIADGRTACMRVRSPHSAQMGYVGGSGPTADLGGAGSDAFAIDGVAPRSCQGVGPTAVGHPDPGTPLRYTECRAHAGAFASCGTFRGDSSGSAMFESVIGRCQTGRSRLEGPVRNVDALERATVDLGCTGQTAVPRSALACATQNPVRGRLPPQIPPGLQVLPGELAAHLTRGGSNRVHRALGNASPSRHEQSCNVRLVRVESVALVYVDTGGVSLLDAGAVTA